MRLFRRDPAKKQIDTLMKPLPESKRKKIQKHLYKQDDSIVVIADVLGRDASPELWATVVDVYAAALGPGNAGRQKMAIQTFDNLSNYQLDSLRPYQAAINAPLLDRLPDKRLEPEDRVKCASILARLDSPNSVEPIRLLFLDQSLGPKCRTDCASILAQMDDQDSIEPIRMFFIDEDLELRYRVQSASILAQMGDQDSIEPIRSLVRSIDKINLRDLGTLLQACHQLGIPEGKSLADTAVAAYCQYSSSIGIGDAKRAFEVAVPFFITQLNDDIIDFLGQMIDLFVEKLKALRTFTAVELSQPSDGLRIVVEALATSSHPKVVDLLVHFIKEAASLSDRGREVGPRQFVVLSNISAIRGSARRVIHIWQQSDSAQALAILKNEFGEEQVEELLKS